MAKEIIEQLKEHIKAHPAGMRALAERTKVKYDIIRRIVAVDGYSPTLRSAQPLLDFFGLELVEARKRNGKTLQ